MENASWSKINVMTCLTSHYVPKTSSTVLSSCVGGPRLLVQTNSYVTKHSYQPCRTFGRWIKENICFSIALKQFCFCNSWITSLFLRAVFKRKKIEGNLQTWSKTVSLPYFRSEPKWKNIRKHLFPLWKSQIMLIIPSKYLPFLSDFHSVFHLPSRSLCLSLSPCDFNEMDEVSFVCVFKKDKEKRTLLWWQDHRQMSGKVACRWE